MAPLFRYNWSYMKFSIYLPFSVTMILFVFKNYHLFLFSDFLSFHLMSLMEGLIGSLMRSNESRLLVITNDFHNSDSFPIIIINEFFTSLIFIVIIVGLSFFLIDASAIPGGYYCAPIFFILKQIFVLSYPDFLELTFSMTSVTLLLCSFKFVFVTSFLLLGLLRDLPHSKKWLLNSLMEF